MRFWTQSLGSLALLVAASVAAHAIVPSITSVTKSVPSNEVFAGYSYATRSYDQTQSNTISGGMNGGDVSYKFRILPWVGLKFDGSYYSVQHQYTHPQIYFFLAGPQVSQHFGRYNFFVHGLVGIAHLNGANPVTGVTPNSGSNVGFPLNSNYTVAAAVGGGVDRAFNRFFAWRVTGDFLHTNFTASGVSQNQLVSGDGRISTGPVLRF